MSRVTPIPSRADNERARLACALAKLTNYCACADDKAQAAE